MVALEDLALGSNLRLPLPHEEVGLTSGRWTAGAGPGAPPPTIDMHAGPRLYLPSSVAGAMSRGGMTGSE